MQNVKLLPKGKARGKIEYMQDLFALAGGSTKFAAMLDLSAWCVENWRKRGIPFKYWPTIVDKLNVSSAELYHLNLNILKRMNAELDRKSA